MTLGKRFPGSPWVWMAPALCSATIGCLKEPLESRRSGPPTNPAVTQQPAPAAPVLLEGTFEQVAKAVTGSVRLERHADVYELVVRNVTLNDAGPVHVYFVGLDQVRSTHDLDEVDAKYDFGPLEESGPGTFVPEHRIQLPSKPAPNLRSVALINPRFGVVLAASSLHAPRP